MRASRGRFTLAVVAAGVFACLCLAGAAQGAVEKPIFSLSDPTGDDHGDGTLQYPMSTDLQRGDLDLVTFAAYAQSGGTVFEATFARRIRQPERRAIDELGMTLDRVARLGFYTFNIDVYIDTDRIPYSGSTQMLPGRRATIAAENAWEKAVCLTPRPNDAQNVLRAIAVRGSKMELKKKQGSVSSDDMDRISSGVSRDIASSVFFPTLVTVNGRSIRFFVPDSFLGGPARDTWSYVVAVSGADWETKIDVSALLGSEGPIPSLMILPILPGRGMNNFGTNREGDNLQPDLIDIIVPPGMTQEAVLKDYDLMGERMVALPGVVPADVKVK
jgi:hypothetical protein